MSDIAEKAGVSRSTVSLVLNRRHETLRISDITCRKVLDAAKALGYHPNEIARSVATGKSHVLGFLTFDPAIEHIAKMLAGAVEEADAEGYLVKIMRITDEDKGRRTMNRCIESRLAGIVSVYVLDDYLDEFARYGIPVARLDAVPGNMPGMNVVSDDIDGARKAVDHLVSLGHRRIAFAGAESVGKSSQAREDGYRLAMASHGLDVPENLVARSGWDVPATEKMVHELLAYSDNPPTGLFCASDYIAMCAIRTARGLGLDVPGELSVVGFADLILASFADPPLTTIAQPFHAMGRFAVRALINNGDQDFSTSYEELLPTELIVRGSTGPASR